MGKRKARRRQQQQLLLIGSLSKKQKKHLQDFGEEHPFYDRISGKEEPTKVCELSENSDSSNSESDTESDSEQVSEYHKLLATLKTTSHLEEEEDESEEESNEEDAEVNSNVFHQTGDEDNDSSGPDQELAMPQHKATASSGKGKGPASKKANFPFRAEWLGEVVETDKTKGKVYVKLQEIFQHNEDTGIVCKACAEAKISGDLSTARKLEEGWKLDYLKSHLLTKSHESAVRILRRQNFGTSGLQSQSNSDGEEKLEVMERQCPKPEEIKPLIDNVLLAIQLDKYDFLQAINDHLGKYMQIPSSNNDGFEFLESISAVVHAEVMSRLRGSAYHTLIIDQSTDIAVTQKLILYFKFRDANSTAVHQTVFGGIVDLTACNTEAITAAVKDFYTLNRLDMMRMVMFSSDGASVMLGKNNGVATQLKQYIPHLVEQHCVAHCEDLGLVDAWKEVPMMQEVEMLLKFTYSFFIRSTAQNSLFEEMARVADSDCISFKPLHEVRWLSRHFAVNALMRNYEASLAYFQHEVSENDDPSAKYCVSKLSDPNYHIILAALNDVLGELVEMYQCFQKSSLTTMEAVQLARAKIRKMRAQYLGETVFRGKAIKSLHSAKTAGRHLSGSILQFISFLCDHLDERFPENELKEWAAFDFLSRSSQNLSYEFGIENISKLLDKYRDILELDQVRFSAENAMLGEKEFILNQYQEYKFLVEVKCKTKYLKNFQDIVTFTLQNSEEYSVIAQLLDIYTTFQASSADCERGFSLMNLIQSTSRNRLNEKDLDMLMRIKFYMSSGGTVDLDKIYDYWKTHKDRKERE